MAQLESTWEQLEKGLKLATDERHTLVVHVNDAQIIELDERQFLTGAHVLLPRAHPLPEDPALQGISALSIVAQALRYAADNGDRVLLVAAHAEPPAGVSEPPAARQGAITLSQKRAANTLALLQGDRDAWIESCDGCDATTFRHQLRWAASAHAIDCDPGDDAHADETSTRKALRGLRVHYTGKEEPADASPYPEEDDYGAIFDLYEITLAQMLEVKPEQVTAQHAKLKLHDPEQVACGAGWPSPSGPRAEHLRSRSKNRIDLMFLQTGEPIPEIAGLKPPGLLVYADSKRVRKTILEPDKPKVAHCLRMTGAFFDSNKTFLLPSAIPVMRNLVALHEEKAAKQVLIVGHTDTTAEPSYNDPLSLDRAKAVTAFLQADVEAWYKWYEQSTPAKQRWGKREDMAMLGALPDGAQHLAAPKPVKSYQEARGLEPDDDAGPDTRRQLIGDYMALDGTTLPPDVTLTSHGCGENFPYAASGDNKNEAANRRVEFFLFEDAIEPPPAGENSAPGSTEYGQWRAASITTQSYSAFALSIDSTDSPHFAPEHETLEIAYSLNGIAYADVTRLRLHAWTKKDKKLLGSVELARPYTGTMSWDGSYRGDHGRELIGLHHGEYLITIEAETRDANVAGSNEVAVSVLVQAVELRASADPSFELDPMHRKTVDEFVKELGGGDKARVILDSSLFKLNSDEMNDSTSSIEYDNMWRKGPSLPFLAKVFIKSKGGDKVHQPASNKGASLIFDFAYDDSAAYEASLAPRALHAQAKTFLKKVAAHKKTATDLPGCAAHDDIGGLRGRTVKRWLAADARWTLTELEKRPWAMRAECSYDAKLDADCAIYFVAGRMAGDIHKLTAYYEGQEDLDVKEKKPYEDLDATRKSKTITTTTWRRIFVSGNNESASTTHLDIPALGKEYEKAAVIIEPLPGLKVSNITADWKKHYKSTVQNLGNSDTFVKYAAELDPGAYPVRFVSFADYQKKVASASRLAKVAGAVADEAKYRDKCDDYAYRIYSTVTVKFPLAEGGLNFFKFGADGDHNRWKDSYTAGIAPSITGYSGRTKSVFFVFKTGPGTDTLIHEVGHLVFLAHAPGHFDAGKQPGGYQPAAHDKNDVCIMSYAKKKNGLCGICLVKLAGWKYSKVHNDGTIS
jgi:outer membrane protein OmpA-like peptidoglycan-associated protein